MFLFTMVTAQPYVAPPSLELRYFLLPHFLVPWEVMTRVHICSSTTWPSWTQLNIYWSQVAATSVGCTHCGGIIHPGQES